MKKIYIIFICFFICVLLLGAAFYLWFFLSIQSVCYTKQILKDHNKTHENNERNMNKKPKLFITYWDKNKIPQKVYHNLQQFAPSYEICVYDDHDGELFLAEYFHIEVLDQFKKLKGAHKADLLRYCLLYIYGGVYLDVKTELIYPIHILFQDESVIYSVISHSGWSIHQGVLAAPAQSPFLYDCIQFIIQTPSLVPLVYYHFYVSDFYKRIQKECNLNSLEPDHLYQSQNQNQNQFYLFIEKCTTNACDCYDKLDHLGLCCLIYKSKNETEAVIKTRYADYPWK